MKKRSALFVYLALWLTGGLYFFYWLFALTYEVNIFQKANVINIKILTIKLSITLVLYSIGIIFFCYYGYQLPKPYSTILFFTCLSLGIYWLVLILGTMRKIGKEIIRLQIMHDISPTLNLNLMTFLFFVWFTDAPYLQANLNKVILYSKINGESEVAVS
ncbi:MAG TPA: hypothetical protein VG962_14475 [Steroidobacteraceae bacterium]|nr:hypothetical protein [Steroidobacteraceae bacterium]